MMLIDNTLAILLLITGVSARFGRGSGNGGMGHGGGGMHGGGDDGGMEGMSHGGTEKGDMMDIIHYLMDSHDSITRKYSKTANGIESYTYSSNDQVSSKIQTHVYQMMSLMNSGGHIRMWDDLFWELFEKAHMHEFSSVTNTTDGVRVVQSVVDGVDDEEDFNCTKALIQEHAKTVSKFVDNGMDEMHKNHPVPDKCYA